MGAVQRLATVVVLGLVALASVLILYLADEPNRLETQAEAQQHDAVERAIDTYLTQCIACHGPAGEGYTAPGEAGTGRIGAAIGGDTSGTALNQTGIQQSGPNAGKPWSDPNNPQFGSGLEGRANFIRNRVHAGLKAPNGTVLMPAFGQEYNGPLNDSQIDELVTMIQHVDWNEVYNKAIETNGGYPTPPPAPTATGQAAQPTQQPAPGGQQTTFEIDMVDIAFQPTELKIPANTDVTITAVNKGNLPHTFTVPGVADTGEVAPGQSVDVKVNLKPGTYDFHCAVPGHEAAGMVGKLVAEEGAGGGAAPAASPAAGGAAAPSGQPTTIEVDMVDLAFTPAEVRIPANTDVTIHAVNSGALPHTLTIPEVADTGEVPAGATHDLTVNLPPGEYPFHCAIPGHEAAGMVGKLIVEAGAAPAASGGAASPAAEAGGAAAAPTGPVEVDMVDLAFNPTELTIPANTDVTIHAVNSGALPHTFTIPDVADTGEVAPGDSKDVVVNLPPGTYDFHCAVPGHEAAGMTGKLIVTEGGGAAAGGAAAPQGTEQAVVPGASPHAAGAPGEVKTEATPPEVAASPAPAGQPGEVASPAAGGETSLPTTYEMDLKDIAFDPAELTIPADTDVTINLVNSGVLEHTFDIENPKIESGVIPGGGSGQVVLNLPAGEYEYICVIPGHKDAGMVGKLTVVASGGAAGGAATPAASPAASPVAQTVDLDMVELRFVPDKFEIPADTNVQVNLSNSGNLPHNFSIKDKDVSVDLAAGDKTSFVLNLPAGTYKFFCDVPGHEGAGMVGTLTVKEGAVASPTAAAGAGGGSANLPTTYEMDLKDIAFDPAELTIPANTDVTINLVNSGVLEHTFDIVDPKIESGVIPGGGSGQVVLNLPPGEYEYICIIPGHKDAGMVGKLTVK